MDPLLSITDCLADSNTAIGTRWISGPRRAESYISPGMPYRPFSAGTREIILQKMDADCRRQKLEWQMRKTVVSVMFHLLKEPLH